MLIIAVSLVNNCVYVEEVKEAAGAEVVLDLRHHDLMLIFKGDLTQAAEVFNGRYFIQHNASVGRAAIDKWAVTQVAQWVKQKAAAAADTVVPPPRRQYWDGVT